MKTNSADLWSPTFKWTKVCRMKDREIGRKHRYMSYSLALQIKVKVNVDLYSALS